MSLLFAESAMQSADVFEAKGDIRMPINDPSPHRWHIGLTLHSGTGGCSASCDGTSTCSLLLRRRGCLEIAP
jgi:hypothetical protein